ncbi:MAG TPA: hypothetical protein VJQ44_12615 [Gemmatimonadales bacterium]|nr:hypothetical protein [Gemmatimonadales bacterium]
MRVWTLVACGALLTAARPAAAQISVAGIRDLAFGPVIVGIPSTVAPSDAIRSGQFRFTAPAGARVRVDFDLPSQLSGPGGAKLPIKFAKTDAVAVGNAAGSVPVVLDPNPKANQKFDMGANTAVNVFLGGTVTPATNQAPGGYVATIVLTVTVQ